MDTTLEDYIASNTELQDTINCVKAQINATKMGKNMLKKVSEISRDEEQEEEDDDVMEIQVNEQDQEIWKGPSSKKAFLGLDFEDDIDDDEFERMYEKLNSDLKQVNIDEKKIKCDENYIEQSNKFDLRQILDKKRFDKANDMPSVTSQQWRLREPNIGLKKRPAGMPPLVPTSLLHKLTSEKTPKKNYINSNKGQKKFFKDRNFSQRRFRNNSVRAKHPQIWDHEPFANTSILSDFDAGHGNLQQLQNSNANIPNVAAFIDAVGGVQCLPLNTVIAAATYLNGNGMNGARLRTSTNTFPLLTLNDVYQSENTADGLQRAAGCNNIGNALNNMLLGRSNLHGIRGGGRVERCHNASTQNDINLQRALKMFFKTFDNNDNNESAMKVDETLTNNNIANQVSSFTTVVQNILKRGIVVKLAEPEAEI